MKHPYLYLWAVSLLCLISFLCYSASERTLDINVHDTYYVIRYSHAYVLLAILYFIIGLPYLIPVFLKRKLYKWAVHLHVWGSVVFFGYLFIYLLSAMHPPASLPVRYYTNSAYLLEDAIYGMLTMILFLLFFIGIQILALANCTISIIKKPETRN
jgi:heme/copper-type cytochrome/quinol oxidase subunit 1